MKKISIIVIIVEIFFCFMTYPQKPTFEWMASFHNQYSNSLDVDNFGNIFVSGVYWDSTISRSKFLTLKYNSSGVLRWYRLYCKLDSLAGGYSDIAYKNKCDGNGNVYVAGMSVGEFGDDDVFIIKYNSEGDTIWTARFDRNHVDDYFADMIMDRRGNIYVACSSALYTSFDYTAIKYDSSGNRVWTAYYNNFGSSADFAQAIAIDSSLNVYLAGYCTNQFVLHEYVTVKFDSAGTQQWFAKYTSYYNDAQAISVGVDKLHNVYVTGYIDYPPPLEWQFLTAKYDMSGNQIWAREFGGVYTHDAPRMLHIDSSDNILLDGSDIVKYDSSGALLWADTLSGGYGALGKDNNFYVASSSSDSFYYNWIQTTRYTQNGTKDWIILWNSSNYWDPRAAEILVDKDRSFYIRINAFDTNGTIILLKYSQLIGILINSGDLPDKFELHQNYPNPFNPNTIINYKLPLSSYVNLKVYDVRGREVATLVNQKQNEGTYTIVFDGNACSSGVYFYALIINGKITDCKKMVLIK